MKKTWYTIKLFYYILKISKNPEDTMAALKVAEALHGLNLIEQETAKLRYLPEFQGMWAQKKMMKPFNLKEMQKLPVGTVGRAFADHMISRNLDPDFYNVLEINSEETYAMMRLRQTHDLWHVFTGFDTNVPDELGLQAFMLAQTHSPLAPMLIGSGLVKNGLMEPAKARDIVLKVSQGWQMGMNAKNVFAIDWESHWETPLKDLRSQYQVQAQS